MEYFRYLGVDFGLKNVGLALGDVETGVITPLKTLTYSTREDLGQKILSIIVDYAIKAIVIGLPVNDDGSDSLTTAQVRNFKSKLEHMAKCPVYFEDERYTSSSAQSLLTARGIKAKKQKQILDQMAAVVILESFIARTHNVS